MNMYKENAEAVVTKQQIPAMEKCGWYKTKKEALEASASILGNTSVKEDDPQNTESTSNSSAEEELDEKGVEKESTSNSSVEEELDEKEVDEKSDKRQTNRGRSGSARNKKPSPARITKK